jgi:hypothetical protein
MASTQNSISSLVAQFLRLQKNSIEIINGLNEVATSTNDNVQIEMLDEAGFPTNASIPAYGYLRSQIQRLDSNIQSLAGLGDNFSTVRNPDGTYSQIYRAQPLRDPSPFINLQVPSTFSTRDNWFFESFLSPLLYISIDVTGQLPDDADRVQVKRIIANTDTDIKKAYFDANLNGRNDITEQSFINSLVDNGISYFVDEDTIPLPLRTIRNKGTFSVISFYDDTVSTTDANGQVVQETRRNYKLNSVQYTDTSTGVENGRTLAVGNFLLTTDGSRYEITSINIEETSVQLKRTSGFQPVQIGADTLTLLSTDFNPRLINVNVGYDERQGIFFKKIDDNYNIVASTWSGGIIFFSNQLRINTTSGVQTLEQFYLNSVADLGQMFLGMAKEKKIPAINGLVPDAPTITTDNFRVVQINTQLTQGTDVQTLNDKIALKATLQSEISQLDTSINTSRAQINNVSNTSVLPNGSSTSSSIVQNAISAISSSLQSSTQNTQALQANLNSLTEQRVQKQQLLASVVNDISTISANTPQIIAEPKYRVRGFWPIPQPKVNPTTGPQAVIQFIIEYRYLSDSGVAPAVQQINFLDNNGQQKTGAFTNWNQIITDVRKKVYDPNTGTYVWAPEFTDDADVININQLDIPITKGERVEIRIKSLSEAGWPDNPLTSDFSESVVVTFPTDLTTQSAAASLNQNIKDEAVLAIQQDLSSKGIDTLLSKQFSNGSKTYLLDTPSIASGFFDSAGTPVDLFQKLVEIQDQLNSLKAVVEKTVGILQVSIVDSSGNSQIVNNGQTIKLNAGYYNQIFSNPLTSDAGKIAATIYQLTLTNTAAGLLELSSALPGGLDTLAGSSTTYSLPTGYSQNLRYGQISISVTSLTPADIIPAGSTGNANDESFQQLRQASPYASGNANSQFIYPRWKSVGLDQDLYFTPSSYQSGYNYQGNSNGAPQNGSALIPFDPSVSTVPTASGINASVWNGGYTGSTGSYQGLGNGYLSEFCIHKDHPALSTGQSFTNLVLPNYSGGIVVYPYFRQSDYFYIDTTISNYWMQLGYGQVNTDFVQGATATRQDSMYPYKLGFEANDEYLIGRYSCGSYLFLGPVTPSAIQVQGSTSQASQFVKEGQNNSLVVPLIFQFRAVDKLGYIGGFRANGNPTNINYTKKLGIDIQVRNESPFSFDVEVTGKYKNDTLSSPNFANGGVNVG